MAFEIVDGMTGTKHISSDDLAALNTATVGKADCVLEYGDDFALTMQSANSATLGTGVGMVGGKRFWNQAATSLTVQSGTQGQKRNDLIVARYAKTSAGIESITPVVIKGTPTTGTAADPEVTANDLKLWRVPLDGINAGTPVKLFEPVASLSTIGDSVSRVVLFNDKNIGFKDTVTLSQDPSKFAHIKFTCITDDKDQFTVDYVPGLGTTRFIASCARINMGSGQVFLKTRTYDVIGCTVNTASDTPSGKQYWHSGQVSIPGGSLSTSDKIKIVRAVGYMS